MSELTLFNSKGSFVYPDEAAIATLSASERERFETVRLAYEASAVASADEAEGVARVQADMIIIADLEQQIKGFEKPSFLQLHRENFGKNSGSRHPGKY